MFDLFRARPLAGLLAALVLFPAWAAAEMSTVSGTVTYRERMALPPTAVLDVRLVDISRADAPSETLSSQRFAMTQSVPFPFALTYDAELIDPRFSYAVQADILVEGQTMFRSTTVYPVLTRDAGATVDMVLERAAASDVPAPAGLTGTSWAAFEIGGRMLVSDRRPTLMVDADGRASGVGGCNNYSGQATISDTGFKTGPMAATMMACPPPYDELERDYFSALESATGYVISDAGLALTNAAGATVLRFAAEN